MLGQTRWQRSLLVLRKAMPWLSLGIGLLSAFIMDRSPGRIARLMAAASGGWIILVALLLLHRLETEHLSPRRAKLLRLLRFSSLAATQWLIQLTLFFSLPFYVRAAAGTFWHGTFLFVLVVTTGLTLWDPLCQAILVRPIFGLPLQAFSSFAGLNVALPVLGLSNRVSLWAAALGTALTMPLVAVLTSPTALRRRIALGAVLAALLAPASLLVGSARILPAVPLRLLEATLGARSGDGTEVEEQEIVRSPSSLVCLTTVWAPRGLRDALVHVWRKDGRVVDRIPVTVEGGQETGFHTWTVKRQLGARPAGRWSCTTETSAGQILGARTLDVAR